LCVFSFFYFKYKYNTFSINFGANLNAQNAGNGISVLQISKIFWGVCPRPSYSCVVCRPHTWPSAVPIHLWYMISQKRPFSKNATPHGKILKKGPDSNLYLSFINFKQTWYVICSSRKLSFGWCWLCSCTEENSAFRDEDLEAVACKPIRNTLRFARLRETEDGNCRLKRNDLDSERALLL
jgi:hypothetical protein